jgi:hypothetical protein
MAGAVACMGKDIENRPRRPPASVVGSVLCIHAGLKFHTPHFDWMLERRLAVVDDLNGMDLTVHGCIVAVCRVSDVVEDSDSKWWMGGPYGLVLRDVTRLWSPVPCKGKLGYWTVPHEVAIQVASQVTR